MTNVYDISSDRLSDFLVEIVETIDPFRTGYNGSPEYGTNMNISGVLPDGSPWRVMMHPFCWCDREDCAWCASTVEDEDFETEEEKDAFVTTLQANDFVEGYGAPNFLLDINGKMVKIWWYKYIGRSMEATIPFDDDQIDRFIAKMRSLMENQKATFAAAAVHEHIHEDMLGLDSVARTTLVSALEQQLRSSTSLDATIDSIKPLIAQLQRASWCVDEVKRVEDTLNKAGVPDRCQEDIENKTPEEFVLHLAPHARLYPLLETRS